MESSPPPLCVQLKQLHASIVDAPAAALHDVIAMALRFLHARRPQLLAAFSSCAWTLATAPREPQPCFEESLNHVVRALAETWRQLHLNGGRGGDGDRVKDAWTRFYMSISTGCCAGGRRELDGARYVIRLSPNTPPFDGQLVCVPTLTPANITERSYADRRQCELALSLLARDNVALVDRVFCNEYGCYQVPLSTRTPQTRYDTDYYNTRDRAFSNFADAVAATTRM